MSKPSVTTKCVANTHTGPADRIIEFSDREVPAPNSDVTGGLISFHRVMKANDEQVRLMVSVYRTSGPIDLLVPDNVDIYMDGKRIRKAKRER